MSERQAEDYPDGGRMIKRALAQIAAKRSAFPGGGAMTGDPHYIYPEGGA